MSNSVTSDPGVIRLTQFIHHPPASVWRVLTDPALHAKWWAAGDVRAEVGHRFTLDMGKWGQQPCTVLEVENQRLLRYSFADGALDTTITWRLEPENGGTRLYFEHAGFDMESPMGKMALENMSKGWPSLLARIEDVIASA
ncbi:MAG TPA: SRPBCC domain-containing protein [Acidobacteriaceae bacterium]|nr:SRPBCC domain-containing protein [Acidobacteriaceae bacterium]